ncbi:hypothetical protein Q8A67_016777 [Cirrhinus molitorella]|uniref:Uncharacterized protein n=1 Tax=Cirrhinus molitorella TaxID=172907 RepID=A0AA88PKQ7_9TELE|nr:hypothetical protein Q8A67_016777 [Cirrhinus molitorella]
MSSPIKFSNEALTSDTRVRQTVASPVSSCVSMKSNDSICQPPNLCNGTVISNTRVRQTAASPVSSCVSMKSNDSICQPPNLSNGTVTSDPVGGEDDLTCTSSSFLQSSDSLLRELDLSNNNLQDSEKNPQCQLEKPRPTCCNHNDKCCKSNVQLSDPPLKELDLSLHESEKNGPQCQLNKLRLAIFKLLDKSIENFTLASQPSNYLQGEPFNNDQQYSRMELISAGLMSPYCKLQILRLAICNLTDQSCKVWIMLEKSLLQQDYGSITVISHWIQTQSSTLSGSEACTMLSSPRGEGSTLSILSSEEADTEMVDEAGDMPPPILFSMRSCWTGGDLCGGKVEVHLAH